MIEIVKKHGEIEIFKSYSKYIKFYKIYCLFFVLLVSFITLKFTGIFFNFLSIIFIIGYIYISLFCISTEKIIIKEDYLIIQALNNNEKVLYSKKILLEEVKKVYFKNTFGISLMLDPGILNYLFNSKQKFMKIETKKTYSFGLFLDYNDFLKIDAILQPKIEEHKDKKIILNKYKRKQEKLFKIYNLEIEERYKYDVQILNVLATNGLKASSIAHEMKNDRNTIAFNNGYIIDALKEYKMWDILNTEEKTEIEYKNVPYLLDKNSKATRKILLFMDSMLDNIEKKQFQIALKNIVDIVDKIKEIWEKDYSWINIEIKSDRNIDFELSEDILHVVFDNLILNSIQQNEEKQNLDIKIYIEQIESLIKFKYTDNGKGLEKKYLLNPKKILEVHETTRKNGHGLGMWILNNTVNISGEQIFSIEFTLGRRIK